MRLALAAALALGTFSAAAHAAEEIKPPHLSWASNGVFGTFDRKQLQRGLQVYVAVCSVCHGLRHVAYRNLVDIGLTPSEAKAIAQQKEVDDIGDDGQPKKRKADLKDRFVSPFANAAAGAATHGKAPPDLSLIVRARKGGADYCHAILTGYSDPPKDWKDDDGKPKKLESGQNYNKYFPGNIIAMSAPLTNEGADERVKYGKDEPKPTIDQMARDVCAFLTWTSEPKLEERKRTGVKVVLFLLLFIGVFFVMYRRLWRNVH